MKKTVIILRSVPGAGKSTVAEYLQSLGQYSGTNPVICCADDYFMVDGEYKYEGKNIGKAHEYCFTRFTSAINDPFFSLVIVANTSTRTKDVEQYRNAAIEKGAMCFVMTIENWHDGKDVHDVPEEVKSNMRNTLRSSIKL